LGWIVIIAAGLFLIAGSAMAYVFGAMGIPTAVVTFAVPLMVGIIFFHLLVRIVNIKSETGPQGGER
jgi:hypothetical protein